MFCAAQLQAVWMERGLLASAAALLAGIAVAAGVGIAASCCLRATRTWNTLLLRWLPVPPSKLALLNSTFSTHGCCNVLG